MTMEKDRGRAHLCHPRMYGDQLEKDWTLNPSLDHSTWIYEHVCAHVVI